MAKLNKTRYAILGVLEMHPCSGYDIKKFCDYGISHFWNENFGHIYPVLKEMEKEGLITKKVEQNEGKPSKNVYFVTEKGRDDLAGWLLQPEESEPARLELLLKLYFAKNMPRQKMLEKLQLLEKKNHSKLDEFLAVEKEFTSNEKAMADVSYPYWLSTLRYGILFTQFRADWLRETIDRIKEHSGE